MSYTLRPYQSNLKTDISKLFDCGIQAVVMQLTTGGGKTIVFTDMVRDAIKNSARSMVCCNRTELIDQAKNKLNAWGLYPTIIDPSYRGQLSDLYVSSIQTLRNRALPEIDLLIIDEAHIRDFDPIVMEYKRRGVYIIGATATPLRYGKKTLPENSDLLAHFPKYTGQMGDIYDDMVCGPPTETLIEMGSLCPAVTFVPDVDLKDLKKREGEFTDASMFAAYNKVKMYAGVVENYEKFAKGKRAICFNINVEHSQKVCEEFNRAGIRAEHVDGTTKNREEIFERFHNGTILVLCNCEVATTGYDEPFIECVIINRPTNSENLYLQMCGRGSRPADEIGKTLFTIIDLGLNFWRFGYWEQEREYSLARDFVRTKTGVAPTKICTGCEAFIPLSSAHCKFCKSIQIVAGAVEIKMGNADFVAAEQKELPAHLKIPIREQTIEQLEATREAKKYHLGWVVRQLMIRSDNDLQYYASFKKYNHTWIKRQRQWITEEREKEKEAVWSFMKKNPHLSDKDITDYAERKLKMCFPPEQVESLIPIIVGEQKKLRDEYLGEETY